MAATAVMAACTKQKPAAVDYSVFEEDYYYMSTEERAQVWEAIPEDSIKEDSRLSRYREAFQAEPQTAVGCTFTDFTAPTPAGGELSLSSLVGKTDYVLIDFWASWCPPCRALMPRLKELYAEKNGTLEILGVSLDAENDKWLSAIEKMELSWQHVSDLKGWECVPAAKYGVFCIPTLVLIDREGTIIARGCDEEAVLAQIK